MRHLHFYPHRNIDAFINIYLLGITKCCVVSRSSVPIRPDTSWFYRGMVAFDASLRIVEDGNGRGNLPVFNITFVQSGANSPKESIPPELYAGSVNLNTYDALNYANLAQNYDDAAAATRNGLNGEYLTFAQDICWLTRLPSFVAMTGNHRIQYLLRCLDDHVALVRIAPDQCGRKSLGLRRRDVRR